MLLPLTGTALLDGLGRGSRRAAVARSGPPSRPDHGNRTRVWPARVRADAWGKGARMSDSDALPPAGPGERIEDVRHDEDVPDPAADLVAPEAVREADR